jgi:taurine dioxygenase
MSTTSDHATITTERVGGALGAVVSGVDLTGEVSEDLFADLRRALDDHQVIFLRSQDITSERQLEVAAGFGTPSIYPLQKLRGATEPQCSTIVDNADSPPTTDGWHTDVTWIDTPPVAALLSGQVVPEYGGDTMWASTAAAYDDLSDTMKTLVDGLEVVHTNWPGFCATTERKAGVEGLGQRIRDAYPDVVHPLVRTHPNTGRRSLFISSTSTMSGIVGMHDDEATMLLDFLRDHLDQPKYHCRWLWSPHDLAIWDERVTNPRGVSDHYPLHGVVWGCTVDGARPYFDPVAN